MSSYKGIQFTITARAADQSKIIEAINAKYPESTFEFIDADVTVPRVTGASLPPDHLIAGMKSKTGDNEWKRDGGANLIPDAGHVLIEAFASRLSSPS